jgi:preprotein translocase subunit SecD
MERSWWWKTIGVLLLTALAVIYILPTFVGEDRLPAWFTKTVKAKVGLGLDLLGGIHLVYEVEMDKAVSDKTDRLASDIEERLRKDKKVQVKLLREGRDDILISFPKPSDIKHMDKKFLLDFRSQLTEVERDVAKGTLHLRMDENYIKDVEDYASRQAIETIRGRVDKFGVAEPSILAKGRDIVVELPGLTNTDFERVKKVIGRTAQLEFKIIDDSNEATAVMQKVAAAVPPKGPIEVRHESYDGKQHGTVAYIFLQTRDKKALDKFIEDLPKKGVLIPKTHEIGYGEEQARDEKGNELPEKRWSTYYQFRRAELTGDYVADAEVSWDERTGRPEVSLTFDHTGAGIFERVSGDHIGDRMSIILDNKVNSAPVFQSRIGGGRARITLGGFKDPYKLQQEAKDLVAVLRAGALPAPLRKSFETQVGPSLGSDSVNQGALAFIVATVLVVVFMLYYYRFAGFLADLALAFNVLFILAVMAVFQSALTLPGIAGIVLTLGMAVDANVLINERIREEMRVGKTPRAAIETGYNRAFWTIFDSQLTTAISGFVLLQYGTGPLRGFAVTLLIGIFCSVFTSIVITRLVLDLFVAKFKPKKLSI